MDYLRRGSSPKQFLKLAVKTEILAFHLSGDSFWLDRVALTEQATSASGSVRSFVLVQESSSELGVEMATAMSSHLSVLLSKTIFPSLERVYYLTEEPNNFISPL